MDAANGEALPSSQLPTGSEGRRPIGSIFVELGFITSDQLDAALVVQRQTGSRIGEILVEQGSLTRLDLASALAEHWEPRRSEPDTGWHSLPNAAPTAAAAELGWSAEDHAVIAALELRLKTLEERLEALPPVSQRRLLRRGAGKEPEDAVQAQVRGISARLDAFEVIETTLAELRESVDDLAAERVGDALATGARLAGAEADRAASAERLAALADEVGQLRAELEVRPAPGEGGDPGVQLLELSLRLDRTARDGHDRVTGLAEELRAQAARARADAEQTATALHGETGSLAARIDELLGLRRADAHAARVVREQLEERLQEIVARQRELAEAAHAPMPAAVEAPLRDELKRVAARVAGLSRRLDERAAIEDEQARTVERAVRKGLADLGKRLVGSDGKVKSRGKGLRRSIERLGAAIAEADARLAGQIPVAEAEGYVAFAPTDEGYRLVELPGRAPDLGSTIELDGCHGPLAVNRYGRSPLPFDGRTCVYLDPA